MLEWQSNGSCFILLNSVKESDVARDTSNELEPPPSSPQSHSSGATGLALNSSHGNQEVASGNQQVAKDDICDDDGDDDDDDDLSGNFK